MLVTNIRISAKRKKTMPNRVAVSFSGFNSCFFLLKIKLHIDKYQDTYFKIKCYSNFSCYYKLLSITLLHLTTHFFKCQILSLILNTNDSNRLIKLEDVDCNQ